MGKLKDTIINGLLRVNGSIFGDLIQARVVNAPTAASGTTYGPGTNGQVLKSNGSSAYWATDNTTYYGTCSTATGSVAKVVTCDNFDALITGVTIAVNFTVANTADGTLTLNVNSTGAKTIYYRGAALARPNNVLLKGVCLFVYDGTYWHLLGNYIDTNTTYTANTTKLATTTVPNVTSVGSVPTLGTAIPADDITAWTTNTATTPVAVSVSGGGLSLTSGSKGTSASLSYTAKSIPNVTSVGSAPTLGTAITVATGSVSSSGSGATVATGITAS